MSGNVQTFEAGDVVTQSGITLKGAKIVYATYGTLAPDKSNVIVYPTSYSANHAEIDWLIKPGSINCSRGFRGASFHAWSGR